MTLASKTYSSDGVTTDFAVTFDYLDQSHVKVSVNKVPTTAVGSLYKWTWNNATNIRVDTVSGDNPVPTGVDIKVFRETPIDTPAVVFGGGASLSSENLNKNAEYLTYALQEATDNNEEFTKLYLGSFSDDPLTDNDGDPIQDGAVYYNTVESLIYYYSGTGWVPGLSAVEAALSALNAEQSATDAESALASVTALAAQVTADTARAEAAADEAEATADQIEPSSFATSVQGTRADEAHGWGDHSIANYAEDVLIDEEKILQRIQTMFLSAATGVNTDISYYVVGDSTRDNSYSRMMDYYYPYMLGKVGVNLFDWARSGHSAQEWHTNASEPSVDDFLLSIAGNEANTIVEFSMGLNDFSDAVGTDAEIKAIVGQDIRACLDVFVQNNLTFFLVTPVWTLTNTSRNEVLTELYRELALEYRVPLIDVHNPLRIVYDHVNGVVDESKFYHDGTHQWPSGSMRIVNTIFGVLLPPILYNQMSLDNDYLYVPETASPVFINGSFWRTSDGAVSNNSDWTRLEEISVIEGSTLTLDNPNGTRDSGVFVDGGGSVVSVADFTLNSATGNFELLVPTGAVGLRLNVDDAGQTVTTIQNGFTLINAVLKSYKSVPEINKGVFVPMLDETLG